ncbi:HK97 gp10 family phage protein [Acinetobacter sp. NIPH 1958]|uniref:HK97-gp10 family putative phage morphogenesis protein n=1 Tax=Acinetobacter sp. NIPH 1958 TaxID=2923430 RepID=UPI001F4A5F3A|nr:HK97-gp10 family putative phage morphogenesis protein [Acinetobacter sp. NIPH 1958]MCH7357527.1 HK97 gp10 family phage protein [Acinetobacter sp. NIPH 1958]
MAGVEFDITGLDDVVNRLQRLANPRKTKSISRKAARQAMNIVRDAARLNARAIDDPDTREKIWKNIKVSPGKTRNKNEIRMRVGVDGGAAMNANSDRQALAAKSGGNTTYWRFLELGTSKMPATPFMRPALATNIQQVTNKFVEVFNAELDKELANL